MKKRNERIVSPNFRFIALAFGTVHPNSRIVYKLRSPSLSDDSPNTGEWAGNSCLRSTIFPPFAGLHRLHKAEVRAINRRVTIGQSVTKKRPPGAVLASRRVCCRPVSQPVGEAVGDGPAGGTTTRPRPMAGPAASLIPLAGHSWHRSFRASHQTGGC